MSPKKGSISKGIFMGYFVKFFLGNDCIKTASNPLGPVHRKSCRSSGGSRGGAVAKASATVADPTVRAATGGFCNVGIGSTWGEEHLEKEGEEQKLSLVIFMRIFVVGGVEIHGNTQVFCKGASMVETSLNNWTYV